jgi:membrane protease YdiL (CAAX protease family)
LLKTIWQYALLTAIYEELVWRVCIQTIFSKQFGLALGITLTAIFFVAIHTHRFKNNYFRMLDLGFFSIILGCIFGVWQAFWVVVLIHFLRNGLIVVYRYGRGGIQV